MEIKLHRTPIDERYSTGIFTIIDDECQEVFKCVTIERGWLDNKPNISCVPVGTYELKLEASAAFGELLWELKGVDGRSECKIHVANHWHQLKGCIAVGEKFLDFDGDGALDVLNSRKTLDELHHTLRMQTETLITITQD